jgi:hypothetical protein
MLRRMRVRCTVGLSMSALAVLLAGCGEQQSTSAPLRTDPGRSAVSAPQTLPPLKDPAVLARGGVKTPSPAVVTADMTAACAHIEAAMAADRGDSSQGQRDWKAIEAEMHAAWRAGRDGSNENFVQRLIEPGAVAEGDTQTLGDALFSLAVMCGLPVPGPQD